MRIYGIFWKIPLIERKNSSQGSCFTLNHQKNYALVFLSGEPSIFKNKKLSKDSARERLHEWYCKVADCTLREIKSVRDTIKAYEDEILNYFISRATNASAESLNSKLKAFRSQLRGGKRYPVLFLSGFVGIWIVLATDFIG